MAGPFDVDPMMQSKIIELERFKVAAKGYLSANLMRDMNLSTYMDHMRDQMIVQLSTQVTMHELATEDVQAPFEADAVAEFVPQWLVIPQAVGVLAATALALTTASLPALFVAMAWALVAVVIFAKNPPQREEQTIYGSVTVPVRSYAKFPEDSTAYPDSLGRPRMAQMIGAPSVSYATEDYEAARDYVSRKPVSRPELVVANQLRGYEAAWKVLDYYKAKNEAAGFMQAAPSDLVINHMERERERAERNPR